MFGKKYEFVSSMIPCWIRKQFNDNIISNWFDVFVGDEVVLLSTDYDTRQAEVTTIKKCDDCSPNEVRINRKAVLPQSSPILKSMYFFF